MNNFGSKVAIATVAFATVGSTVFGGVALAVSKKDAHDKKHVEITDTRGTVGAGGDPTYYCTVVGIVQNSTSNAADGNPSILLTCAVTANGGDGGAAAEY